LLPSILQFQLAIWHLWLSKHLINNNPAFSIQFLSSAVEKFYCRHWFKICMYAHWVKSGLSRSRMSRNYEEFKEFKLGFECYDSNLRINAFFFFKRGYRSPGVDRLRYSGHLAIGQCRTKQRNLDLDLSDVIRIYK
jgi:hypothetical protein